MIRLTKELQLLSARIVTTTGVDSQALEFNLARRSAVVINSIESTIYGQVLTGDDTDEVVQEVDLDPDNTDIWGASVNLGDAVDMDSSRLLRHRFVYQSRNGTAEALSEAVGYQIVDFRMLPMEERPISITNMRHHLRFIRSIGSGAVEGYVFIRYLIVELSLQELGIINAGRR